MTRGAVVKRILVISMVLFAAIAAGIPRLEGANPNLLNINHIAEPRDWN